MKGRLTNWIFKHLYNGLTENDVLRMVNGALIYRNTVLLTEQKRVIIEQAKTINSLDLWKMLCDEMKVAANKRMYFDSKNEQDMLAAKMVLWTVDVMEKKIQNLSNIK
jgi:hypothetical protein